MKNLTYRSYTDVDYKFAHDLHRENMLEYIKKYWGSWNSEIFRRDLRPDITWIIELNKQKIGFFILSFNEKAVLMNIQIKAEFHSKGIGKAAIKYCEQVCINHDYTELYLQVFLNNPARTLYERLGFETYEINDTHYKMKKDLSK